MRALIVALILLGCVIGAVRAWALNPQPLPPGIVAQHLVVGRVAPHL